MLWHHVCLYYWCFPCNRIFCANWMNTINVDALASCVVGLSAVIALVVSVEHIFFLTWARIVSSCLVSIQFAIWRMSWLEFTFELWCFITDGTVGDAFKVGTNDWSVGKIALFVDVLCAKGDSLYWVIGRLQLKLSNIFFEDDLAASSIYRMNDTVGSISRLTASWWYVSIGCQHVVSPWNVPTVYCTSLCCVYIARLCGYILFIQSCLWTTTSLQRHACPIK